MEGMSEREYAAHAGLSRGAIQKAKASGRLVLHADGSTRRRAGWRRSRQMKPVPETAVSPVGETLREHGLAAPTTGGGMTFLQAKTANEVLKVQERKLRLAKLKASSSSATGRWRSSSGSHARSAMPGSPGRRGSRR
jgi:hypothetical protein